MKEGYIIGLKKSIFKTICVFLISIVFVNLYYLTLSQISKLNDYKYENQSIKESFQYLSEYKEREVDCKDVFFDLKHTQNLEEKTLSIFNLTITSDSVACVLKELNKKDYEKISLYSSKGGETLPALYLADYLQENNIYLNIRNTCLSSCTYLVFQTESTICKKSENEIKLAKMMKDSEIVKIGVHKGDIKFSNVFLRYFLIKEFYYDFVGVIDAKVEEKFKDLKIDYEYIREIEKKTSPKEIYIFNEDELINKNIIKESVDCY